MGEGVQTGMQRQSGATGRQGIGLHPPILGDRGLCGPAFSALQQQLQVVRWKLNQVPEGPRFGIWWPALEHILKVQGLYDFSQWDLEKQSGCDPYPGGWQVSAGLGWLWVVGAIEGVGAAERPWRAVSSDSSTPTLAQPAFQAGNHTLCLEGQGTKRTLTACNTERDNS